MNRTFKESVMVTLSNQIAVLGHKKLTIIDLDSFVVLFESNHVFNKPNEQICAIRFSPDFRFFLVFTFSGKVALFEMDGKKPILRFVDNAVQNCSTNENAIILFDEKSQSFLISVEDKKQFCTKLKRYSYQGALLVEKCFTSLLCPLVIGPSRFNSPYIFGTDFHLGSLDTEDSKTYLFKIVLTDGLSLTTIAPAILDTPSELHMFLKYTPIHFYSETDYIGYCSDPKINRQGFYRVDLSSKAAVLLLDMSHLIIRYDDIGFVRYDPQTESVFAFVEKVDSKSAIGQKVQTLKCDLRHQTISYLALIERKKPVIAVSLIDCNEKYTVFTNTHRKCIEFIENGVSGSFKNGSTLKIRWFRSIQWGIRNIIHLVLFGISIVDMLLSLIFFPKDPLFYAGELAFISIPVILFFIENRKSVPLLRAHFLIDMFLVLAIISLFLVN